MIERDFDVPFIAGLALREKQIQQNYRPIIAVHKWFARRPGTLFRGLLLSEFASPPLAEAFYRRNDLHGIRVADPFMGGGTPLFEANRVGCEVSGYDINPMSYWIVKQEIEHLDLNAYRRSAQLLRGTLEDEIGHLYRTKCLECGSHRAHVKYFLWVKVQDCCNCGREVALFPGYLVAENRRHPNNVFACAGCGDLTEAEDRERPGHCNACGASLTLTGPAKRSRCACPHCGEINRYPAPHNGPPKHRMYAIEYHCPSCKSRHTGRFFKKPDPEDMAKFCEAESRWSRMRAKFVPDERIPAGDETSRLHRWGYGQYREMFNARQLLGLETGCRFIEKEHDVRVRNALATNLSDLLRYQNMLCRYDVRSLKSLDIFSVHGFPVGLIQCESNLLGIQNKSSGVNVGSGGWSNVIEKFFKAKWYCDHVFEVRHEGRRKVKVPIEGEWIGDKKNGSCASEKRKVKLTCGDAAKATFAPNSLDAVLTDPPYFGNVQYAELMDFCYVWLRRLVGDGTSVFKAASTRSACELTGNNHMGRGLEHFAEGLSAIFQRMGKALKPGAPLVFTYHHNKLRAYYPIAVAILDSGLVCSASLPCPAEMAASIHISGTASSIIDTVFVCRSTGKVPRNWIAETPEAVASLVDEDLHKLQLGNVRPTQGDIRCIIFGHLIRLAIWHLRERWQKSCATEDRLRSVARWIDVLGGPEAVQNHLGDVLEGAPRYQHAITRETEESYSGCNAEVSF